MTYPRIRQCFEAAKRHYKIPRKLGNKRTAERFARRARFALKRRFTGL